MGENESVVAIVVSLMFFSLIVTLVALVNQNLKDRAKAQIEKDKIKLFENAVLMGYSPEQINQLSSIMSDTISPKSSGQKITDKLVDSITAAVGNIGAPQNSDRYPPPRIKN